MCSRSHQHYGLSAEIIAITFDIDLQFYIHYESDIINNNNNHLIPLGESFDIKLLFNVNTLIAIHRHCKQVLHRLPIIFDYFATM